MHKHEVSDYENLIYNILKSLNLDIQNNQGQGYNRRIYQNSDIYCNSV